MLQPVAWQATLAEFGRAAFGWLAGWGRILHFGALMLVMVLSPASYAGTQRRTLARHLYLGTVPLVGGFTVLCAFLTVIITRIVVATALSYGVSQYALGLVIRVLVLELIPLTAALFVALRCTMPGGADLSRMRRHGELEAMRLRGIDPVAQEVLPRVLAGVFASVTLAALSCVVALVTVYLTVYGFTVTGHPTFTRLFGQIFSPVVTLIFLLKTLFFSLAVSLIPIASGLYDIITASSRTDAEMRGLVRMFAVLLMLEVASLIGNYY